MAKSTILQAKNNTGSTLLAGRAVYLSGFDDTDLVPTIAIADNRDETKMPAIGIVREDIENNEIGVVKTGGPVFGFDTFNTQPNDDVFISSNGDLIFTDPLDSDQLSQQIGTVVKSAEAPDGQIQLFPLEVKSPIKHIELLDVTENQHHTELHANLHNPGGADQFLHSAQHSSGGGDEISHGALTGLGADDHPVYSLIDGTRPFTETVGGIDPSELDDLATKRYVDAQIIGAEFRTPVLDKDLTTPPGFPTLGDRYIVASVATDDWIGQEEKIAQFNGATWVFTTPTDGFISWVADEDKLYGYTDTHPAGAWIAGAAGESNTASNLGSGEGVFNSKVGVDLQFKSVVAGDGIALSSTASEITVDAGGIVQTESEHHSQLSSALDTVLKDLDGYASAQTESEHYRQHSDAIQTIIKNLDGYVSGVGFVSNQTESEHFNQLSNAIITVRKDLDGYAFAQTEAEHHQQVSSAIQTIRKDLDGYQFQIVSLDQTESEHHSQISIAIDTIRKDLDGYTTVAASGVAEETFLQNKNSTADAIQTILKDLDGYASAQTESEHHSQVSNAIQTIRKDLDGYGQTEAEHHSQVSIAIETIRKDLDGYGSSQTESEHHLQVSNAIQTIRKDLDGYQARINGLDQTESEHHSQISQAIQTIRKDLDGYTTAASSGVSESTFLQNKNSTAEAIQTILKDLDGYGQTEQEHHSQVSIAIDTIRKDLDGYQSQIFGVSQTESEHHSQISQAIQTIRKDLDGYSAGAGGVDETTFLQNKNSTADAIQTILKDLDGYASDQTESEHHAQFSQANQSILQALDGYSAGGGGVSETTFLENKNSTADAIQTILKDLDGYQTQISGLDQTESEHHAQFSQANQSILQALDGYSAGGGGVSEVTFLENKNSTADAIQTIIKDLDGYVVRGADGYINPLVDLTGGLGTPALRWEHLIAGPDSLHLVSTDAETVVGYDWALGIGTSTGVGNFQITQSGFDAFDITPAGLVGINETSPIRQLHVVSTGENIAMFESQSDSINPVLELKDNSPGQVRNVAVNFVSNSSTLGQVGYIRSTNILRFSNGGLFAALDVSGNFGIGTVTPSTRLDVETATTGGIDINMTSTGDPTLQFQLSGTAQFTMGVDNSLSDIFKIQTGSALTSAPAFSIDSNDNVGLGLAVSSPERRLQVYRNTDGNHSAMVWNQSEGTSAVSFIDLLSGSSNLSRLILVAASVNSTAPNILGIPRDGTVYMYAQNATRMAIGTRVPAPLHLSTNEIPAVTINTLQHVGIGTTLPHERLTVDGVISLSEQAAVPASFDGYGAIYVSQSNGNLHFIDEGGVDHDLVFSQTTQSILQALDGYSAGGGGGGGGGVSETTFLENKNSTAEAIQTILKDLDGYAGSSGVSGAVQFSDGASGFSSDDTNFHWDDGNNRLGIGVNSPTEALEVNTNTDSSGILGRAHVGFMGAGLSDFAGFSHVDHNSNSNYALVQNGFGATYLNTSSGNVMRFRIANSDKMTMSTSTLDLNSIVLNIDGAGNDSIMTFEVTAGVKFAMGVDNSDADIFKIDNGSSVATLAPFNIDSNGNIGLGNKTSSAERKLTVYNNTDGGHALAHHNANGGVNAQSYIDILVGASPYVRLYLVAYSPARVSDVLGLPSGGATSIFTSNDTERLIIGTAAARKLHFSTNSLPAVVINENQQVGIGTLLPHEILTVNGFISLQEQNNYDRTHDGYGSLWAKSDGTLQFTNDAGTDFDLTSSGGGVSETTFLQNKNSTADAIQTILKDLDGYSAGGGGGVSETTFLENKNSTADAIQTILKDLDGYAIIGTDGYINPTADLTGGLGTPALRWEHLIAGPDSLHLVSTDAETGVGYDWVLGIGTSTGVGNFQITQSGIDALNITPSGRVGIGTTDPQAPLDIRGFVTIGNGTAPLRDLVIRNSNALGGGLGISLYNESTATNSYSTIVLEANNAAIKMQLFADGLGGVVAGGGAVLRTTTSHPLYIGTAGTEAIHIDTSQRVGIGTSSPSERLDVAGNLNVAGSILNADLSETIQVIRQALDGYTVSDIRLKSDIRQIDSALDTVSDLRGVRFKWNEESSKVGQIPGKESLGLIAQEVEEILPEIVGKTGEYKNVEYNKITAVLVEAIKELREENKYIKERLKLLEKSKK